MGSFLPKLSENVGKNKVLSVLQEIKKNISYWIYYILCIAYLSNDKGLLIPYHLQTYEWMTAMKKAIRKDNVGAYYYRHIPTQQKLVEANISHPG